MKKVFKNGNSIGVYYSKSESFWPPKKVVENYLYDGERTSYSISFFHLCFWFDKIN